MTRERRASTSPRPGRIASDTRPPRPARTLADDPGWELYRSLLAVIRAGSLSAAARALGLTQPTIGRHVDVLEARLATTLFVRSQAGLQPTDAALALVPHAEAMANAAEALVRTASGEANEERGAVRLTASEIVGVELVAPLLRSFVASRPRVTVELMLSSRTEDLLRREADIAIRLFRPTQTALSAKRLGAVGFGYFAHPSYLAMRGTPKTEAALREHSLVGFDSEALLRRVQRDGLAFPREAFAFRCDSYVAQHAAIRAGVGIGKTMAALARRDGLVRIFPDAPLGTVDVWLAMHADLRLVRRMRLLYDFLATELGAFLRREAIADTKRRRLPEGLLPLG